MEWKFIRLKHFLKLKVIKFVITKMVSESEQLNISLLNLDINEKYNVVRTHGGIDNNWTIAAWSRIRPRMQGPAALKDSNGWRIFMHNDGDPHYCAGWRLLTNIWPTNLAPEDIKHWQLSLIKTLENLNKKEN